jgi:hypothetical protein
MVACYYSKYDKTQETDTVISGVELYYFLSTLILFALAGVAVWNLKDAIISSSKKIAASIFLV